MRIRAVSSLFRSKRATRGQRSHRLVTAIAVMALFSAPVAAQTIDSGHLVANMTVSAPSGFIESCGRYQWICDNHPFNANSVVKYDLLELANQVNNRVNTTVSQISDPENYGVAEYWTLPTNGKGDCEDLVLEKIRLLLDAGVESRLLSMAIVLDRVGENHVVLILRHRTGDLVLDSLSPRILPWNQTGYRFLAVQSDANRNEWEVASIQPPDGSALARR
jgi:predicted transglutaminase-like cysteine proteinase